MIVGIVHGVWLWLWIWKPLQLLCPWTPPPPAHYITCFFFCYYWLIAMLYSRVINTFLWVETLNLVTNVLWNVFSRYNKFHKKSQFCVFFSLISFSHKVKIWIFIVKLLVLIWSTCLSDSIDTKYMCQIIIILELPSD